MVKAEVGTLPRWSVAILACFTSGCMDSRGGPIAYNQTLAAPDEREVQVLDTNDKIAPLGKLSIKVFKADDMSGDFEVDLAGHIALPLIGEVEAADLTTAELSHKLVTMLGAKYFENPDVSVGIKESTSHVVTVDGAVQQAGQFPVNGRMTLIQAISLARGTRDDANERRVATFRKVDGKREAAAFDLKDIREGKSTDPRIYAGDIVVIDGSRIKEIQKQVLQSVPLMGMFSRFAL
jgi:polysaccharide biosynthesis/export protein